MSKRYPIDITQWKPDKVVCKHCGSERVSVIHDKQGIKLVCLESNCCKESEVSCG